MLDQCRLIDLPHQRDERGSLAVVQGGQALPFSLARIFYLYDIAAGASRGDHAHKLAKQFFIAIHGGFTILLDDGQGQKTFTLNRPTVGLYVPPLVWGRLYDFSAGAVCLVASDQPYDPDDYLKTRAEFLAAVGQ